LVSKGPILMNSVTFGIVFLKRNQMWIICKVFKKVCV